LSDVSQVLSDHMRSGIKESLLRLMFEEASQLCGGFYHPGKKGNSPSVVKIPLLK